MHMLLAIVVSLVVGAGCGYGYRGWIQKKIDAISTEAETVKQAIKKKL